MKKTILIITSMITQLLIWTIGFCGYFAVISDIIKNALGEIVYTTYGKAVRPYMLIYFLIIFIITEVVAVLSIKLIKFKNNIYLYALGTLLLNAGIFCLILNKVVFRYAILID